jgi:hypothetical protein
MARSVKIFSAEWLYHKCAKGIQCPGMLLSQKLAIGQQMNMLLKTINDPVVITTPRRM